MLIIVMHDNKDYLNTLVSLAEKEGMVNTTVMRKNSIGANLVSGNMDFLFSRGSIADVYDRALVVAVKGENERQHFLDLIGQDRYLSMLNIKDRGFICTLPFNSIEHLRREIRSKKKEEGKMKIVDLLQNDRILLDLKASAKEEAIEKTAEVLKDSNDMVDFDLFLKEVFEREKLGTTAIGNSIAIPHARTDAVKDFVIAFGRFSEGIEFDSLDGKAVKIVFLIGTPKEKNLNSYLKTLAHLARILKKNHLRQDIFNASSAEEIKEAFRKIES